MPQVKDNILPIDSLSAVFQTFSDRRFFFIKPGGNWGDQLIYMGAKSLATRHNLSFESLTHDELPSLNSGSNDVIYIHGAGGFNSFGSKNSYRVLARALSSHTGVVIQGPCTVSDDDEAIIDFQRTFTDLKAKPFYFFAREELTFARMKPLLPESAILLIDQDTALHLSREEFLHAANISFPPSRYDLVAMREDTEKADNQSRLALKGVQLDPAYFATSFRHWIRIHAMAKSLVTNRTHSAIAGAILGIPTTLFSGAYHKNSSIWKYSLRQRGVRWAEINALVERNADVAIWERVFQCLPKFVKKSWKVRRAIKRLQGIPLD